MSENLPAQSTSPEGPAVHNAVPAWEPAAPEAQAEDSGVNLRRYVAAVLRFKWLVVGAVILGALSGAVAVRFLPRVYMAEATIWVEVGMGGGDRGPIQQSQLLDTWGWVELARQFIVLDAVVRDMMLFVETGSGNDSLAISTFGLKDQFRPGVYELETSRDGQSFELRTGDGTVLDTGTVGDSVGPALGFRWVPPEGSLDPGQRISLTVVTPRDAAVRLSQNLNTRIDRNGTFLRMTLEGSNPSLIAATVNATAERYVEVAAEIKRAKLTELTQILETQLQYAEERLERASRNLEGFRVRTITLPSDRAAIAPGLQSTRDPVFSRFFDLRIQREALRTDRNSIERAIASLADSSLLVDALTVIPSVQGSPELTQALAEVTGSQAELRVLRRRYTDDNPQVQRLVADIQQLERVAVPQIARALIAEIEVREQQLELQLRAAAEEMQQIPVRTIEEARLEREMSIATSQYTNLKQRFEEAKLAEASSIPDVRILDRAIVPRRPISDQAPKIMMMAVLGSLGAALLGAILLDRLDRRVRYPEQVSDELGLPILGAIPHVKGLGNGIRSDEALPVIEALRGVRLALAHAYGAAGPLVLTISSPGSGDGKSFVAANLALAFADAGQKTLLIDGDLRRGEQHQLIGAKRKPGLTDFLNGDISRDALVQATPYPSLSFVGGGTRMASAPELLGSGALTELIATLRSAFSVILIDSPPLSVGVDPYLFATASGHLLVVLRTGVTDRELAEAKLDTLDRLPVRVLGAILNDVRPGGQYRYYSYEYYASNEYSLRDEVVPGGTGRSLPRGSTAAEE